MEVATVVTGTVHNTDANPTAAEVQAIHDDAGTVDGDVILLPAGTFSWTTRLTITKAITLRGAGGGGILLPSYTAHLLDTGSATFTMRSDHFRGAPDIVVGETLRVYFAPDGTGTVDGGGAYMEGEVTDYTYPTVTIDVTIAVGNGSAINGSGTRFVGGDDGLGTSTEDNWLICRMPETIIECATNYGEFNGAITVSASSNGNSRVEDMMLASVSGGSGHMLEVNGSEANDPVIVSGVWFRGGKVNGRSVVWENNHGVMTGCTWDCGITVSTARGTSSQQGIIHNVTDDSGSWERVSTMGTDDTDGTGNLYIEDSYVHNHWSTFVDMEDNSRIVVRYSILDGSNVGGHEDGRHWQNYKNGWLFKNDGNGRTPNTQGYQGGRSGTGVCYGNFVMDINSSVWGNQSEFSQKVYTIDSTNVPAGWSCWGNATPDETVWPATEYPAPRQPGFGYVDGSGDTLSGKYLGDFEPMYIWGNTGFSFSVSVTGGTGNCEPGADEVSAYVRVDTDGDASIDGEIIVGVAKPGWAEYTYPHPLVSGSSPAAGAAYGGRLRFDGTGSQPVLTDQSGSVPIKTN